MSPQRAELFIPFLVVGYFEFCESAISTVNGGVAALNLVKTWRIGSKGVFLSALNRIFEAPGNLCLISVASELMFTGLSAR